MEYKKQYSYQTLLLPLWVCLTYLFLYIPLIVLVAFSFNSVEFPYRWVSFSWRWYYELFASVEIWQAAWNSLVVGCSAVFLSIVIGLLFVMWNAQRKSDYLLNFFYPNLVIPEIVLTVGLLSFFVFFTIPLGLMTVTVGHTLLGLGYTIPILNARFATIDRSVIEASLDLGATYRQTFFKVIVPILTPALLSAGLLVFILSLDDFLIAFFCAGTSSQTLPLFIFSMIRTGVSPMVNALATVMMAISGILVVAFCSLHIKARVW